MNKWRNPSIAVATIVLLFLFGSPAGEAQGVIIEWTAEGDGISWSDPVNWSTNNVPSSNDTISIFNCSPYCDPAANVVLDVDFTLDPAGSITIFAALGGPGLPSSLTIGSEKKLTNNGVITNHGNISVAFADPPLFNGAVIDNFGSIDNFGGVIVDDGGTVTNWPGSYFTNEFSGVIDNAGTFENECSSNFSNFGFVTGVIDKNPCQWDGGGDGLSWNNPQNWDPDGVPISTDAIAIDDSIVTTEDVVVHLNTDFILDPGGSIAVDFRGSGTGTPRLVVDSGKTLTNSALIENSAIIDNNGTIDNVGIFRNPGTVINNGTTGNEGSIENSGTFKNEARSVFTNKTSGTINDTGQFENLCGSTFTDSGTIIGAIEDIACFWDIGGDRRNWSDPFNWGTDELPSGTNIIIIDNRLDFDPPPTVHLDIDFTLESRGEISVVETLSDLRPPMLAVDSPATLTNYGLVETTNLLEGIVIENLGVVNNFGTIEMQTDHVIVNGAGSSFTNESSGVIDLVSGRIVNECGSTFHDFGTISGGGIVGDSSCLWTGSGDGSNWSDPYNWLLGIRPTGTNIISIHGAEHIVHLDIDFTLETRGRISIAGSRGTPEIMWPSELAVDNGIKFNNNGRIETSSPEEGIVVSNFGTFNNFGTINVPTGLLIVNKVGGTFTNEASGTINLVDGRFDNQCGSTFYNFGGFTGSGPLNKAACYWDGRGDGSSWSDRYNWLGNDLPTTTSDVFIWGPDDSVHLDVDFTLDSNNSISIESFATTINAELVIDENKNLINYGVIESSGSTARITNFGTIENLGTVHNSTGSSFTNEISGFIDNQGQFINECSSNFDDFGTIVGPITNIPCPEKLVFTVQPTDTFAGETISAITVEAQDSTGNKVTSYAGIISIEIGNNPSGGVLSGSRSKVAESGEVTFNNLSIDQAGASYSLLAAAEGIANATSASFNIDSVTGMLTLTKLVVNDDGGIKVASDFSLFVDDVNVLSGESNSFAVGDYTVSETADPGYAATISGDCAADGSVTLNLGDVKICAITNDDIAPILTVIKVVVNDDGGDKIVTDFPLFVDDILVVSGVSNSFEAGAHWVTETLDIGYSATISGDCSADGYIVLNPGDVKSCTITNDDIDPETAIQIIIDEIIELVDAGELDGGEGNSLVKKLENALRSIEAGHMQAALGKLTAFANQISAFMIQGVLTPEEGQPLLDEVNRIIAEFS